MLTAPLIENGMVIENPAVAMALLPTCSGFFFGSEQYDEYYFEDVKHTKEAIDVVLEHWVELKGGIYYHAWW